ncbi:hypothetical protein SAMN02745355_0284 [Picrophilus oshimae DSM 9789]|uniref:N-acetyltransferase domain-containing protein n=2 Tax=Picrophilus oshimae TaxID=46632 RepID=A0A8G2L7K1_PICTO|nr:hypothetical protein SAMN02745355_0284 [Picrophilus oshimae DSM 9789]
MIFMIWKRHLESKDYIIREANPRDARQIIDCMQSVMDEKIYLVGEYYLLTERGEQERLKNPDELTLVCEINNKIVGVLTLQRGFYKKNRHTANLGIAIMSGYRGIGIGTRMIRQALEWAMDHGIEKVNLEVFSSNKNAISLYKHLGFEIEGIRKNQFIINGSYVDDILMTIYTSESMKN